MKLAFLNSLLMTLLFSVPAGMPQRSVAVTAPVTCQEQPKDDHNFGQFINALMDASGTNLSVARRNLTIQTLVRVADNIFTTEEHRRHFAILLAIESKFNNAAKSPVGAVGIAQLMPKYAKEFAKVCGIADYSESDLADMELNMTIGACQFRALLESPRIGGNVAAALVAYNAGQNSSSLKQLMSGTQIQHPEPPNYVAKFTYLSEEVRKALSQSEESKAIDNLKSP